MEPIDFEKLIEEKIFERGPNDRDRTKDPPLKFSPSSAGYCERQQFLSRAGLKKLGRKAIGSMKSGTLLHRWIESHINGHGLIEQEVRVDLADPKINPFGIYYEGTYDYYDYNYPYDFKSTSNINYVISSPTEEHKDQITVYMAGLGAKEGAIVYIDKRDLKVKQHMVEFDEKRLVKIFKRSTRVYDARLNWDNKTIPFPKCGCFACRLEDEKIEQQLLNQNLYI